MVTDFELKTDCRHVRWDRPCAPHKLRGKRCDSCDEYAPVRRRILLIKLAATGDVLRTTAFLPAIHAAWPEARVTWLTRPAAAGLLQNNALVDEVLLTDDAVTAARLQTEEFDVVLCPDADPSAAALCAMARAAERRGYVRDERGRVVALGPGAQRWLQMGLDDAAKKANTETYQALVARALDLDPGAVREPMLEPTSAERADAEVFVAAFGLRSGQKLVGLNTGAGGRWRYKQWTLEHQRSFLQLCHESGIAVLLLGGPEEVERHRDLLTFAAGKKVFDGGNHNAFGRFAALIDRCDVVVTGDSLAAHCAAARQKPAVVLFGPTSAAEIDLYGRGAKLTPPGFDCLCCYLPECDKTPHCQAGIEPQAVLDAVKAWA
jgi:heptosyltransferase-2